jgi:small subunit ribosomal protein S18
MSTEFDEGRGRGRSGGSAGDKDGRKGGAGATAGGPRKRGFTRRKVCRFCADKTLMIDYKDPQLLKYFITDRGKIIPRRISGNCAKHQRKVALAVRRSRMIALMPYTVMGD